MSLTASLWVALGGALGSVARWQLGQLVALGWPTSKFPLGTFLVNVLGCLAIGVLAGLNERGGFLSADMKLFLFTGILGGFTTFSAFGLETFGLLRRGELLVAGSYAGFSVLLGLAAVYLGFIAATK